MIVEDCGKSHVNISRTQVGCLLLILFSISCLNHKVLGARYGKEVDEHVHKFQVWRKSFTHETPEGSYETVNREVPTSPDPLHNR